MANGASQLFKDDEEERDTGVPSDDQLRHITGIGEDEESSMDREATNGAATDIGKQEDSFYRPEKDPDSSPASGEALAAAEGAAALGGDEKLGQGFTVGKGSPIKRLIRLNRKRALVGGGVGGAIILLLFLFFAILIPLKIEALVTDLENHFFSSSEDAVDNEGQSLLSGYIHNRVLPGYTRCGTTIDRNCSAISIAGTDPISRLYNDWANQRFETKLADNYGISFEKHSDGTWVIKTPGAEDGVSIGHDGDDLTNVLQTADKGTARAAAKQAMRDATQGESQWKKVFYRYKVGRLLEEKYGIRRCMVFCGITDPLSKSITDQKITAKLYLNEKVITPLNQTLGLAVKCVIDPSCSPESDTSETSENPAENDAPESSIAQQANAYDLADLAAENGANLEDLTTAYNQLVDDGFQKTFIKTVLAQAFPDLAESGSVDTALDKIPLIGWINLGTQLINAGNGASGKVKALSFVVGSAAAVKVWEMYQSYADEEHTGHVTATEVGSMTDSLSSGDTSTSSDPQIGGTAGAEQTPLYASLIDDSTTASDGGSSSYTCSNGKPVPSGQLVCNEEVLNGGIGAINDLHDFLNSPGVNILTNFAKLWGQSIGKVFSFATSILGKFGSWSSDLSSIECKIPIIGGAVQNVSDPLFPGYCSFKSEISKIGPDIIKGVSSYIVPRFIGLNMSGGRTFDAMAAGADTADSATSHEVLGGQVLTDQQVADNITDQQTEAQSSFKNDSLFARMFSTSTPDSLLSKLAIATPLNIQASAQNDFASILSNPFSVFDHGFASLFSSKASAAGSAQDDPFGIVQYGYPDNSPVFSQDPQTLWNQYCSDGADGATTKAWDAVASLSSTDADGVPTNSTTDPCLLIQATVGSLGATMDSSLLTPDDLADIDGNTTTNTTTTAGSTIDLTSLDQDSTSVACAAGTNDIGNYTGYSNNSPIPIKLCSVPGLPSTGAESNGQYGIANANGLAVVNSRVSGAVLAMVQGAAKAGVSLSATSSFRTMAHQQCLFNHTCDDSNGVVAQPGYSNHQMGLAIDFAVAQCEQTINQQCSDPSDPMWEWLSQNAATYGYKSAVLSEAWHWSPTGN